MSETTETARAELLQALHRAARIERAETIRKLLRKLHREGQEQAWPGRPAVGDCR